MIYIATIAITLLLCYVFSRNGGCHVFQGCRIKKGFRIKKRELRYSVFLFFCFLPCVLTAGLRYGISVDYLRVYVPSFRSVISTPLVDIGLVEIGYKLVVKACALICDQYWFMFFCMSLITIALLFVSLKNNSKDFFLSVILLFGTGVFFDTFNGVRQYLAVAVFAYSYRFIREKNIIRYLVCIAVAISFHTSAIFLVPLYWLSKLKLKTKHWIIIFSVIFVLQNQIVSLFVTLMSFFDKYNVYLIRNTLRRYTNLSVSDLLTSIIVLVPCILNEKEMTKSEEGRFLYNMTMFGFAIAMISGVLPLAYRVLYYFKISYLLCIPYVITLVKSKKEKLLIRIPISGLLVGMNTIGIIVLNWFAVLPYESIFH